MSDATDATGCCCRRRRHRRRRSAPPVAGESARACSRPRENKRPPRDPAFNHLGRGHKFPTMPCGARTRHHWLHPRAGPARLARSQRDAPEAAKWKASPLFASVLDRVSGRHNFYFFKQGCAPLQKTTLLSNYSYLKCSRYLFYRVSSTDLSSY